MTTLEADQRIALSLPRTWPAFFQRFGRLTNVQRAAIPTILRGESTLISSATASGKTEAACAPLIEQGYQRLDRGTILYISPTRALVNDLFFRLERPLQSLSLRVVRRTGEHRDDLRRSPDVLITTPESFDSLLCRGRRGEGHHLAGVSAVVLDEIHLLDGSGRGEQVRWLLERLRRLRQHARSKGWTSTDAIQIVALSATVGDPQRLLDLYLPGGSGIQVPGHRPLEVVEVPEGMATLTHAIADHVQQSVADKKILVFSNSRRGVDETARALRDLVEPLGVVVHAHHGSLSQSERERAETDLRDRDRVVVVATSTLEIGIDIGDIDLIVLDEPAPDVAALLQRIGRGNRRSGLTRLMAWSDTAMGSMVHAAMLKAAREGAIGISERGPEFGVIRQQVTSYIFQAHSQQRNRRTLESLFRSMGVPAQGQSILQKLIRDGELDAREPWIQLGSIARESTTRGAIHSTIDGGGGSNVIDAQSGAQIASGIRSHSGPTLGVAGLNLSVRETRPFHIEVQRVAAGGLASGEWRYVTGPWMEGAGQPQAFRRWIGLPEDLWPVVDVDGQRFAFHFGGDRRQAILKLLSVPDMVSMTGWYAKLDMPIAQVDRGRSTWLHCSDMRVRIEASLPQLEGRLGRPRVNKTLPTEVRVDEVLGWLAVEEEIAWLSTAKLTDELSSEARLALELVVRSFESSSERRRSK